MRISFRDDGTVEAYRADIAKKRRAETLRRKRPKRHALAAGYSHESLSQ
jgi:hypothetical protein